MNYKDQLIIIDYTKQRLKLLEDKVKRERVEAGLCPHENLLDATTFIELKEGYRMYVCDMCGEKIKKPVLKGENNFKI